MQKLFSGRTFADRYQFYISDAKADLLEKSLDWMAEAHARRGYISNGRTVYLGTRAHLNAHWLTVYLSDFQPNFDDCERVLAFNIAIESGQLVIASPIEDIALIDMPTGHYVVYILAYNVGVAQLSLNEADEDLNDAEFEQRTGFERYAVVLIPGRVQYEGALKGQKTLY
jgi:hypothetical protein